MPNFVDEKIENIELKKEISKLKELVSQYQNELACKDEEYQNELARKDETYQTEISKLKHIIDKLTHKDE